MIKRILTWDSAPQPRRRALRINSLYCDSTLMASEFSCFLLRFYAIKVLSLMLFFSLVTCMFAETADAVSFGGIASRSADYIDIVDHAGESAIKKWSEYGIIYGGKNGYFWPDGQVTRSDMAASLVQLIGYPLKPAQEPYDIGENTWVYNNMMKLIAANVIQGSDGYVRPYDPTTREEAVTAIARAFNISNSFEGDGVFADWDDISSWAKGYVKNMWSAGYLGHFGEEFIPKNKITRAEFIMIIDSMFAAYYAQPGVYTGTIDGNIIIRSPGVAFMDAQINGDVYIVEGVGDGYYSFDRNTVIEGELIVRAGVENPLAYIDPDKPMVALTFDDGPTGTTVSILNTLEAYGARATFFVVGSRIANNNDTLRRAVSLGCELGGHSWSHASLTTMGINNLIWDTDRVRNALYDAAGVWPTLVRPPNGSYNSTVVNTLGSIGVSTIYWSIDPQDWSHRNANTTYNRIMSNIKDGAIVLMHDLVPSTATAVQWLVPELIDRGYQLVTVSEMLTYSDIGLEPGKLYVSKYNYR